MPTISEIIKSGKFRIVLINSQRRYIILEVEGVHPYLYVPFDLVPVKVLFELTNGIEPSPDPSESCNENGEKYGTRIRL